MPLLHITASTTSCPHPSHGKKPLEPPDAADARLLRTLHSSAHPARHLLPPAHFRQIEPPHQLLPHLHILKRPPHTLVPPHQPHTPLLRIPLIPPVLSIFRIPSFPPTPRNLSALPGAAARALLAGGHHTHDGRVPVPRRSVFRLARTASAAPALRHPPRRSLHLLRARPRLDNSHPAHGRGHSGAGSQLGESADCGKLSCRLFLSHHLLDTAPRFPRVPLLSAALLPALPPSTRFRTRASAFPPPLLPHALARATFPSVTPRCSALCPFAATPLSRNAILRGAEGTIAGELPNGRRLIRLIARRKWRRQQQRGVQRALQAKRHAFLLRRNQRNARKRIQRDRLAYQLQRTPLIW
ncbi:unnamed protein product [Closterium sp. NIES-53]